MPMTQSANVIAAAGAVRPASMRAGDRMLPGTVYTVTVGDRTVFAQVDPWRSVAFFKSQTETGNPLQASLLKQPLCALHVNFQSVGRVLKTGAWRALGVHPMSEIVRSPKRFAHWPSFSETLVVWCGTSPERVLRHDDPEVQDVELMAVWDAQIQVPKRLEDELGIQFHPNMTGPVWRERILRASYGLTTEPPRTLQRIQPISV